MQIRFCNCTPELPIIFAHGKLHGLIEVASENFLARIIFLHKDYTTKETQTWKVNYDAIQIMIT